MAAPPACGPCGPNVAVSGRKPCRLRIPAYHKTSRAIRRYCGPMLPLHRFHVETCKTGALHHFSIIRVKLVQRAIFAKIGSKQHSIKLVHFGPVKRLCKRKTDADNERHPRITGMSFIWLRATQSPVRRDNVVETKGFEPSTSRMRTERSPS